MSAIKVGDLVQVVRGRVCGCPSWANGAIFKVSAFIEGSGKYQGCRHFAISAICTVDDGGRVMPEPERLKRIPPLSELESEKKTDEVTA